MGGVLAWLWRLVVNDGEPPALPGAEESAGAARGEDDGLTVWMAVGSEAQPGPADLHLEAATAERAAAMLRELARLGTVGRVWLALAPELPRAEERPLLRLSRRLRPLGLLVARWSGG
jgi:hypothetical protein